MLYRIYSFMGKFEILPIFPLSQSCKRILPLSNSTNSRIFVIMNPSIKWQKLLLTCQHHNVHGKSIKFKFSSVIIATQTQHCQNGSYSIRNQRDNAESCRRSNVSCNKVLIFNMWWSNYILALENFNSHLWHQPSTKINHEMSRNWYIRSFLLKQ